MAALTWIAIFPLAHTTNVLLKSRLNSLPPFLRRLIITIMLVPLMTYVVMPRITRLFAWWLYPRRQFFSRNFLIPKT